MLDGAGTGLCCWHLCCWAPVAAPHSHAGSERLCRLCQHHRSCHVRAEHRQHRCCAGGSSAQSSPCVPKAGHGGRRPLPASLPSSQKHSIHFALKYTF